MPAMRRSNCIILGAGHPPFVFASKRPKADLAAVGIAARHLSFVD